jgi:hypothetical protein
MVETIRQAVIAMATANPWYGYKRIAVMCRREGQAVKDRHAYAVMRAAGLLQKVRPRAPELYQAAKLFELLPQKPNDLWQMDVTYIHIPGHGWWYAVTVIDYYSRYLEVDPKNWTSIIVKKGGVGTDPKGGCDGTEVVRAGNRVQGQGSLGSAQG